MKRITAALLFSLLALAVPAAWAQTTASSIRGVVRDASGPLAGATVEAVGTQSGFRYTAQTGPNGTFSLAGLAPGVYTLTVSSGAYTPQTSTVQVLVGQDVEMDLVLSPEEVFTEEVTVIGDSVRLLLETRTSEIGTNVTPQQIESLPQNNRNFLGLAALAPGVRFTDNQDETAKFRSGAADSRQVNVFIDGLSYKND
ncbi:MAG: carboxypeptidase-like regulatory domain-containing protein, partial [Thermoanaerobaculia bacterium]